MAGQGKYRFEPRKAAVVDLQLQVGDNRRDGVVIAFQVNQDALLREIVELLIRWEEEPRNNLRREHDRLFWKLPLGLSARGQVLFGKEIEQVVDFLKGAGLVQGEPKTSRHQNVTITKLGSVKA